jgi:tetratricopeptide (TPR) repeat protein
MLGGMNARNVNADAMARDVRTELDKLRKLLLEDARNPVLLRHCAALAIEAGEYGEALGFTVTALGIVAGDPAVGFYQAAALMGLKRYSEAAGILSELRHHKEMQSAADMNLALCFYALRDYAAARPVLETLMAATVPSADVIRLFVSTLHHLGDIPAAVAIADRHSEAGTRDGALAGVYALVYLDASRAMEAARFADRALAASPDSVDGLVVAATLKLARLDTAAAERGFRHALEVNSDTGRAWVGLGTIALLRQDLIHAAEYLERGVAAMPTHVGSWQVLGWTYLLAGNLDAAESVFQRALSMDRNFAEAHGSIASLYALRGRVAEAEAEVQIAERLDRDGLAARYAKAVLMGRAGDPAAGRALILETAASLAPRLGGRAARLLTRAATVPGSTRH